jgi:type IV secretion system protein VirB10
MRILLSLIFAISAFAAEIPPGVHVLLRMQNTVSSKTAADGDFVYLMTSSPVAADGQMLIPPGSFVQGVVSHVKRPGRVKGKAELAIRLQNITLPDGKQFEFQARVATVEGGDSGQKVMDKESTIQQGSTVGKDVARVAVMTASGTIVGAIIGSNNGSTGKGLGIGSATGAAAALITTLVTRGDEVVLGQGLTLDVIFERAVSLE